MTNQQQIDNLKKLYQDFETKISKIEKQRDKVVKDFITKIEKQQLQSALKKVRDL